MSKNPKVGIVIPSYERLDYLKQCVDSAIHQSYENIEIVISDDRSPDPAVREYLEHIADPRVRWFINETNLGTTKNYDTGVRRLSRDTAWCVILDNDDVLDKDFVKEAVATHLRYPQSKVIYGNQTFVDDEHKQARHYATVPALEGAEEYLAARCKGKRDVRSSCVFFEVEQFLKVGGYPLFPSGMCTDDVLVFALAFDNVLVFSEKARIYIRIHGDAESLTTGNLTEKLVSVKAMKNYCLQVYENNPYMSDKNQNKILRHIKTRARILTSALLVKRYREIVKGLPKPEARKSLKEIIKACREEKIVLPVRFWFLANIFTRYGLEPESFYLYRLFITMKQNLKGQQASPPEPSPQKKSLRHEIKQFLKEVPGILFIHRQLRILPKVFKRVFAITGLHYCHCCGHYSLFYWDRGYEAVLKEIVPSWGLGKSYTDQMIKRENDFCAFCGSVLRVRAQAKTILSVFRQPTLSGFIRFLKANPSFKVYEAANYRSFRNKKLRGLSNYIVSEFHPGRPFGGKVNGVRNENLEELTFDDQSFDLIITSDVLEHVSDLSKALSEIRRTLKPSGYHIFTVPVNYSMDKTRTRALMGTNGQVNHLLPVAMHGDDISEGVLAFRDFGADIDEIIQKYSFKCQEEKYALNREHITSVYISSPTGRGIDESNIR